MNPDAIQKRKVLLVEDFDDNRFMLRQLLEMSGYLVVEATNGQEAVELAGRVNPDVILMDLSLPMLDGLSATRHIRKLESLTNVPILAVSAHEPADYLEPARNAGCNEYLTKPIDYDHLDSLLGQYCPA